MSEPEVKFEIDEHGRIGYRATNEGVLLSKDEKEFIIDHITRMQEENAKLRRLVHRLISHVEHPPCEGCLAEMSCDGEHVTQCDEWLFMVADARKLGVEVDK